MPEIRVGTCGFCMRQAAFFRTFPLIEIQKTFYQPPQVTTAERWRAEASEGFEFTLKAFQAITHVGSSPTFRRSKLSDAERAECGNFADTRTVREGWRQTLEIARALRASFVIFQCPKRFRPSEENVANLRRFFQWAERDDLRLGWEPRSSEWTKSLIKDLCRELGLVHVVDPFHDPPLYGTPRYFRLHGRITGEYRFEYRYQYTDAELRELLEKCTANQTYCLFNNDSMRDDAQRFRRLAGQGG